MSTETNKDVYRRFIQRIFNEARFEELDDFLAPDYRIQEAPPGTPAGAEGVRQVVEMFRSAFPDLDITLDEVIAEGDTVAARSTLRGTHRGEFLGVAASRNSVSVNTLTMVRLRDGRLTESWVKNDVAALMRQLGAGAPA
jgi:steroid delta-isomerase-like uncharacterized protein